LTELVEAHARLTAGDYAGAAALARDAIATAQAAGDAAALETLGRELYHLVVADASAGADELRRASDEALAAAAGLAAPRCVADFPPVDADPRRRAPRHARRPRDE